MEKQFAQWMEEECSQIGVTLSEKQMEQFFQYYEMLIQWNEVMNLTAITEMDQVVTKHFVDSMSLVKAVSELGSKEIRIMDLGTGAGFPGIPTTRHWSWFPWNSIKNRISKSKIDAVRFFE